MINAAEKLLENDPASRMLGIQLREIKQNYVNVYMLIRDDMTNGYDLCHGGFIYTLADTASAFASAIEGQTILSASNQIEYLAPASLNDKIFAKAKVIQKSGRNIFCDIKVVNQNDQLIALMRSKLIIKKPN